MMRHFLHISDLHNRPECRSRLKCIATNYPNHILLITGDEVDDGLQAQYNIVKAWLDDMPNDYIIIPGNHSYGGKGNLDSRKKAERFDEVFGTQFTTLGTSTTYVQGDIVIVGLNSNPGTFGYWADFARGKIGKAQLAMLKATLATHKGKVRVVLLHHHLQDPTVVGRWRRLWHRLTRRLMELRDSKALLRALEENCDLVLHGHRHGQYTYTAAGIPVYCTGALYAETHALEVAICDGKVTTRYLEIT